MEICCENCQCSKCDFWRECNDSIYGVENWCERCNEMDIDHCHTTDCKTMEHRNRYQSHPLQIARQGD